MAIYEDKINGTNKSLIILVKEITAGSDFHIIDSKDVSQSFNEQHENVKFHSLLMNNSMAYLFSARISCTPLTRQLSTASPDSHSAYQ